VFPIRASNRAISPVLWRDPNTVSAAAQDVGLRLSGQGGHHGSAGFRQAAAMNQERRLLSEDMKAPKST